MYGCSNQTTELQNYTTIKLPNQELATKPRQPFTISDRNSPLCIRVDQALLLEQHHRLVDALARGADQVRDVTLGQHDADLDRAVLFMSELFGEREQLTSHASVHIQRCQRLDQLVQKPHPR